MVVELPVPPPPDPFENIMCLVVALAVIAGFIVVLVYRLN